MDDGTEFGAYPSHSRTLHQERPGRTLQPWLTVRLELLQKLYCLHAAFNFGAYSSIYIVSAGIVCYTMFGQTHCFCKHVMSTTSDKAAENTSGISSSVIVNDAVLFCQATSGSF